MLLRDAILIILVWLVAGAHSIASGSDQEPAPPSIPVLAHVPAKTYYVGQAIELRIGAEAAAERPEVVPPQIPGAEIDLIDTSLSAITATGIGSVTSERNLFVTRFRLIAHRAGLLAIPPVQVRLGARSGASRALAIEVLNLPLAGRPADFLGGVGAFTVVAEASPATVRVGQQFTYTIVVTGPAARGMTSAPSLARFTQVPLGLQVEPLPAISVKSPPSRRFPYRLRATRPGAASLPPVVVAAFDPQTKQYVTRVTSSLAVQVVAVPSLDPATVNYRPSVVRADRGWPSPAQVRAGTRLGLVIVTFGLSLLLARVTVRGWTTDPGRWLARRGRRLAPRQDPAQTAREIADALTGYLERAAGRPRGALTPPEAGSEIATATRDAGFGLRAAALIVDCDRVRYGESDREPSGAALVATARQLFEDIGKMKKGR
jgi:hypothetical protein